MLIFIVQLLNHDIKLYKKKVYNSVINYWVNELCMKFVNLLKLNLAFTLV